MFEAYLIYLLLARLAQPTEKPTAGSSLPVPSRTTTLGNCSTIQIICPLSLDLNIHPAFELPCSAESHTAIAAEDRRLNEHGAPLP